MPTLHQMVHLTRLRRARDEEHMRLERATLERTARLNSPFLSTLCYAFRQGPWLVLAMPLLSGGTLQVQLEERAEGNGGLRFLELRWILAQLSLALGALHSLNLLHRDVKPSNLVLKSNGYYVLTDFGLSEPPGIASKTGTRGYWAPETIRQQPQTAAADWWSAGVILAYAATGTHPFHSKSGQHGSIDDLGVVDHEAEGVQAETMARAAREAAAGAAAAAMGANANGTPRGGGEQEGNLREAGGGAEGGASFSDVGRSRGDVAAAASVARKQMRELMKRKEVCAARLHLLLLPFTAAPASHIPASLHPHPRTHLPVPHPQVILNEATLHAPITLRHGPNMNATLRDLLTKLLDRDATTRLASSAQVNAHAFLGDNVEWPLLEAQLLPAPYTPDASLVYAKDHVPPLSFHNDDEIKRPASEVGMQLGEWEYSVTSDSAEFGLELAEYVKKFTAVSEA